MSVFDALNNPEISLPIDQLEQVTLVKAGDNLVISFADGREEIVIENYFQAAASNLPAQMTLADGTVISFADIQAFMDAQGIGNVDPGAGGAGGGQTGTGGGAGFAENLFETLGDGLTFGQLLSGSSDYENQEGGSIDELVLEATDTTVTEVPTVPDDLSCQEKFVAKVDAYRAAYRGEPVFDEASGLVYRDGGNTIYGDEYIDNTDGGAVIKHNDLINQATIDDGNGIRLVGDIDGTEEEFETNTQLMGSGLATSIGNDNVTGFEGTTEIIGDVYASGGEGSYGRDPELDINMKLGDEYDYDASTIEDNVIDVANDSLTGGAESQIIVGDAFNRMIDGYYNDEIDISVSSEFETREGNVSNNALKANNDIIDGSAGVESQILVGDALILQEGIESTADSGDISLTHDAGFYQDKSGVISNNTVEVMNDLIIGGDSDDLIAGDVAVVGFNGTAGVDNIELDSYANFLANKYRGIEDNVDVSNNQVGTYNDLLDGGLGNDVIAGDIVALSGGKINDISMSSNMYLYAYDNMYGGTENPVGSMTDNFLGDYNDTIRGDDGSASENGGSDILVGDVLVASPEGANVEFYASLIHDDFNGFDVSGNKIASWNDALIGGAGNDLMVGDGAFIGDESYVQIRVSQTDTGEDNEISLFNDYFCAGEGDDILYGDFTGNYKLNGAINYFTSDEGAFMYGGTAEVDENLTTLFADTLNGDEGNDILVGQLGNDVLTGGSGADRFVYEGSEEWDLGPSLPLPTALGGEEPPISLVDNSSVFVSEGHDIITDFNAGEGDVIDLDALFDNLGLADAEARASKVVIEENTLTIDGLDNFSITVQGDALPDSGFGDSLTSDQLRDLGIVVSDAS